MIPTLHTLVSSYVCGDCLGLYVGDAQHQQDVLNAFFDLSAAFNIEHGQGYVLRALLAGDWWTAKELSAAFDAWNSSLTLIHHALDRLPDVGPPDAMT